MRSIQSIESTLDRKQEVLRWCGLLLLVVQHSTLVLAIPFTRVAPKTHRYDPRVAVLMVELIKFVVCAVVVVCRRKLRPMMGGDVFRSDAYRMSVPALRYVVQHNLLYVALTNLPAVTSMVLVQTKLLWAALFSVLLLGRRFAALDWCAFVALIVGVVLVQFPSAADSPTGAPDGDDAVEAGLTLADFSVPAEPLPVVGVLAACAAAALSGFAGVFLEHMFTQPRRSLFVGNIQLCLYSIPLQLLAVGRALYVETPLHLMSRHEVAAHLFAGFHASVWAVVALQAAGGLIVGMVLKFAGNLPKFFAAATALVLTSLHPADEQGGGDAIYPDWIMKENSLVFFGFADAAGLELEVQVSESSGISGDIDGDGGVDVADLLMVLNEWGCTCCITDINDDGRTDVTDLLVVIGNWGG